MTFDLVFVPATLMKASIFIRYCSFDKFRPNQLELAYSATQKVAQTFRTPLIYSSFVNLMLTQYRLSSLLLERDIPE